MTTANPIAAWSSEHQERAREVMARYPQVRSAVMPLLYIASLEHGHVDDAAVDEVAALTGLTTAQVLSVASFYTMFKREHVGRYLISVCTSISCFLRGADDVLAAVEEETGVADGETGVDGLFSVEHAECIGACGGAPAIQVNYELVEGLTPEKVGELVRWLAEERPEVLLADELQSRFGGRPSFEPGPSEPEGAVAPVPAFGPYGSAGGGAA